MKKLNFQKSEKFQKLSLFDLAAARVKNSKVLVQASPADLIEIIDPFVVGESFYGIVMSCDENYINVYHSDSRKIIKWNRCVNCKVTQL